MIEVVIPDDYEGVRAVRFDTRAVDVVDGALIIMSRDVKYFLAGFAPGQWLTFQYLSTGEEDTAA